MATTFSKSPYANTSYSGADMLATITIKHTDGHKNATCVLGDLQTLSYSTHMERSAVRKLGNINVSDFTNGPRTIAGSLVFAVFNRHMIRPILEQMNVKEELLPDELPPFDITITYANEYGHNSVMRIYGVRLVNEGQVCSINDIYTENTYQYVAQDIDILKANDLSASDNQSYETSSENINTSNEESGTEIKAEDLIENQILNLNTPKEETVKSELVVKIIDYNQVAFDAIPRQAYLELKINGKAPNTYALTQDDWPYTVLFSAGNYVATLQNKAGEVFNSIPFSIQAKPPKPPQVTICTAYTISGKVFEDGIAAVICSDNNGNEQSVSVYQHEFHFEDLEPNTIYSLYCKSISNVKSSTTSARTLKKEEAFLHESFLEFIQNNALDDLEFIHFIEEAKKSNKPLLESCHELYKASLKRNASYPEVYMHLVAYFDLVMKQKDYDFIYKNKWLGLIEKHPDANYFKVYSQSGISSDIRDHIGMIKLQQLYLNRLQKLNTYKSSALLWQSLQKQYTEKQKLNQTLQNSFNARYERLPIRRDTGYFDAMLNSNGAYIHINGHELVAHYNELRTFLVFKEDLNLDVVFKIEIGQASIDYTKLDFYDSRNNYVVYLESNEKAISKSILIQNNQAYYSYDSLLSLAPSYKMQDFIQELILDEHDLFETFCDGFYLLINRKKPILDFVKLFDILFYSYSKKDCLDYILQDDFLCFEEPIYYALFDRQGNLIETGYNHKIKKQLTGYLVWSTPYHQANCLNFGNM